MEAENNARINKLGHVFYGGESFNGFALQTSHTLRTPRERETPLTLKKMMMALTSTLMLWRRSPTTWTKAARTLALAC